MTWKIKYKKQAFEFLKNKGIFDKIEIKITGFVKGEKQDIKKLKGDWKDLLRLRDGKIRVIFKIDLDNQTIEILKAGFRGKIYK